MGLISSTEVSIAIIKIVSYFTMMGAEDTHDELKNFDGLYEKSIVVQSMQDTILENVIDDVADEDDNLIVYVKPIEPKVEPKVSDKKVTPASPLPSRSGSGEIMYVTATAYTADCNGCSGITAYGVDVRNKSHYQGYCVLAADPNVLKGGTLVQFAGQTCIVADTGGAIKGNKIDFLVSTNSEAIQFGRQHNIPIKIVGHQAIKKEVN